MFSHLNFAKSTFRRQASKYRRKYFIVALVMLKEFSGVLSTFLVVIRYDSVVEWNFKLLGYLWGCIQNGQRGDQRSPYGLAGLAVGRILQQTRPESHWTHRGAGGSPHSYCHSFQHWAGGHRCSPRWVYIDWLIEWLSEWVNEWCDVSSCCFKKNFRE